MAISNSTGRAAESRVSPAVRIRRRLGWKAWSPEFNELLAQYERVIWPDLIVLGGGTGADYPKYARYLKTNATLRVAALGNTAGIIGAARVGASTGQSSDRSVSTSRAARGR